MKRPNITPGDWATVSTSAGFYAVSASIPHSVCREAICRQVLGASDSEEIANARAISVVPQLLEALEDALRWSQDVPAPYRDWPFIQKARAALSAAGYEL